MAKRASPQAFQPIPKDANRPKISRNSVVLIEAPQNAPQPCSGLVQRLVHPAAQRLLNLLQLCHHPFFRRLTPDHKQAPWTGPALVNESKECERLRFLLSPLAPVHGRIPAELQQTRLLRGPRNKSPHRDFQALESAEASEGDHSPDGSGKLLARCCSRPLLAVAAQ
jgi:hypothetical protein